MSSEVRTMHSLRFVGIIPARYASTRLPGKPLRKIGSKTIIHHVYEGASESLDQVLVATDDERIVREVESWGGVAVMTSDQHRSGTDRIAEAMEKSGLDADVVINIQGDEPFICHEHIDALKKQFEDPNVQIATPIIAISAEDDPEDPNLVKVVRDLNGDAVYFSRYAIPFQRDADSQPPKRYAHVGMYAFRRKVLEVVTRLSTTSLEDAESLEQLRWLEYGFKIRTVEISHRTLGIDTPEDLEHARELYKNSITEEGK